MPRSVADTRQWRLPLWVSLAILVVAVAALLVLAGQAVHHKGVARDRRQQDQLYLLCQIADSVGVDSPKPESQPGSKHPCLDSHSQPVKPAPR